MKIWTALLKRFGVFAPLIVAFVVVFLTNIVYDLIDMAKQLRDLRWDAEEQRKWALTRTNRRAALLARLPFVEVD